MVDSAPDRHERRGAGFTCLAWTATPRRSTARATHLNSADGTLDHGHLSRGRGHGRRSAVSNTASSTRDDGGSDTAPDDTVAITTHADVADLKLDTPDPVIAGNTSPTR